MAGNKLNTKSKGKDDKSKTKVINQPNEEVEETDFTLLRKPVLTSITGFAHARKIFDSSTEELKGLLSNECDLLYECKVCRNIFRSLANFISHKRFYCKDNFNLSEHSHFIKSVSIANEIMKIRRMEQTIQRSCNMGNIGEVDDDRIPLTKDLTAIVEKLAKTRGHSKQETENSEVILKKIPQSNAAVFQSVKYKEGDSFDHMRSQVKEINKMLDQTQGVMQKDGKFKVSSGKDTCDADNVIQISDDDDTNDDSENNVLKCKICDLQFSTRKTMKFHMKNKHMENRLVYPCPDCLEIFSTSWSVYRHLFKVHRKTAAQIRRLRESIQAKAFKMDNPPAYYEKRKNVKQVPVQKISDEEKRDQENQEWMENLEGEASVPRCGGCGRTFERRAALAAHTNTCAPRHRALSRARLSPALAPQPTPPTLAPQPTQHAPPALAPQPTHADKKIEIQIRKDYNKGSAVNSIVAKSDETKVLNDSVRSITNSNKETQDKDVEEKEKSTEPEMNGIDDDTKTMIDTKHVVSISEDHKPRYRLPFSQQAEKSNFIALSQRIQHETESDKHICIKCDVSFEAVHEFHDHMAEHYKWVRYACKLCNYKHCIFEKLPEHVKVVHKLKGDSDFYYSTVKAVDGNEASELADAAMSIDENDTQETSPDSRRPSRCSSDSSRLSDDSSSSCTRVEIGSRKRKSVPNKSIPKKLKKSVPAKDECDHEKDDSMTEKSCFEDITANMKSFEENSSDIDDIENQISKRLGIDRRPSVASRRPVRKRTRPKNEDFEYDLSNLLKMEAQGYRDSQSLTNSKSYVTKKKVVQDPIATADSLNKDCCGALSVMSKKAFERAAALLKMTNFLNYMSKDRVSNPFVRPMIPRNNLKGDKNSPKKEIVEEIKDISPVKKDPDVMPKSPKESICDRDDNVELSANDNVKNVDESDINLNEDTNLNVKVDTKEISKTIENNANTLSEENKSSTLATLETHKPDVDTPKPDIIDAPNKVKSNVNIPIVPIKLRRESLEVMKNPIINKNINDFKKSGMKTKILVIKPINRNKDGQTLSKPLKFQTIKLKDPSKSSSEDSILVKVPTVGCSISRPPLDSSTVTNSLKDSTINSTEKILSTPVEAVESTKICEVVEKAADDGDKKLSDSIETQSSDAPEVQASA